MKRVLLVLGVIVLVIVAALGIAVYRANDLIAKFKPQLETTLGNAVGAQISLGELALSLFPSTELKAAKVVVKQKGDKGEGLVLSNLVLSLELAKLLSGNLVVSKLELDSPTITIIRSNEGTYIDGLPRNQTASTQERREPGDHSEGGAEKSGNSISVGANDISVKNATVTFKDSVRASEYRFSNIDLKAALAVEGTSVSIPAWDVSLNLPGEVPVKITGKTTRLNNKENSLDLGEIVVALASGAITLKGNTGLAEKTGSITLDARDIDTLKIVPAVRPFIPDSDSFLPLLPIVRLLSGKLDLATEQFSLDSIKLKYPGGEIIANGALALGSTSGKVSVSSDNFDLSTVAELLKNQAPVISQYALKGMASPKLDVTLNGSAFDIRGPINVKGIDATIAGNRPLHFSNGTGTLKATITKNLTSIETKDLAISLNEHPLVASTTLHQRPTGVEIPFLALQGFGGTVLGTFNVQNDGQKSFATTLDLKKLDVSQLLSLVDAQKASTISGTLHTFKGKLSGSLNPGGPQSWNGSGAFEMVNGLLKDVNIPGAVLQKIDNLPVVAGSLAAHVPDRFKPMVSSKDTTVQRLAGSFDLARGLATIKGLALDSDHFSLQGEGTYNLVGPVDLNATILFSKDFSAALVASAKEIRNVLDSDARLVVPLTLKGTPPEISIVPNTAKLLELAAKGALRTHAGDALEKTLDKKLGTGAGKNVRKTLENLFKF